MNARDAIFARIRQTLQTTDASAMETHLARHARGPLPTLSADLVTRFRECATRLESTVAGPLTAAEVPAAIARYLDEQKLPRRVVSWPGMASFDWKSAGVEIETRPARGDDLIGVTGVFCGIAETGTLMLLSGAQTPPTVSLLPETHIALLPVARIVAHMEDGFDLLRKEHGSVPRAINFVSGPSRTADIEQTVTLGAHGPYRVLIILTTG
ncbi:MAG: lactate utilization protein C [Gammaproteobacteria bacterium]|nr:MAG: lactate utilization protein C [Gammaproteobacteria bacterium]